jgi:hypothetical protein
MKHRMGRIAELLDVDRDRLDTPRPRQRACRQHGTRVTSSARSRG